ncbi:MAG: amidohydrolase family protein [Monoglobales bacterium]
MKIIDAHAHIFPTKIAAKATKSIGSFYESDMFADASVKNLTSAGDKIGVEKYLVCSSAVTPDQAYNINEFIGAECKKEPRFLGFAALHPLMKDYKEELAHALSLGLKGVKIHSDFQKVDIDDSCSIDFYREFARNSLPVLFHMGDSRYDHSSPDRLASLMRKVPDLVVFAAHFGGYMNWDKVALLEPNENLYFDTSSSLAIIEKNMALRLNEKFGVEKFFFGTDFPMWNPEEEIKRLYSLGLSQNENRKILYDNFANFFKL